MRSHYQIAVSAPLEHGRWISEREITRGVKQLPALVHDSACRDFPMPAWVGRAISWVLNKAGFGLEAVPVVSRSFQVMTFDVAKVDEFLCRLLHDAALYRVHPAAFVIGWDVAEALFAFQARDPFSFGLDFNEYRMRPFYGLEVHVVPWLKGATVVPEARRAR